MQQAVMVTWNSNISRLRCKYKRKWINSVKTLCTMGNSLINSHMLWALWVQWVTWLSKSRRWAHLKCCIIIKTTPLRTLAWIIKAPQIPQRCFLEVQLHMASPAKLRKPSIVTCQWIHCYSNSWEISRMRSSSASTIATIQARCRPLTKSFSTRCRKHSQLLNQVVRGHS